MLIRILKGSKMSLNKSLIKAVSSFFPVLFIELTNWIRMKAPTRGIRRTSETIANGLVITKIRSQFIIAANAQKTETSPRNEQRLAPYQ